jgi:hypothetical protein
LRLHRGGGLGDFVFLEPALRVLKAIDPSREIILCGPDPCRHLYRDIGADKWEMEGTTGPTVDLNWTLETHPAMYCLDRVSLWELILGLPIGTEVCQLPQVGPRGRKRLFFAPFTSQGGLAGRSLPVAEIERLLPHLCRHYEVVMASSDGNWPAIDWGKAERHETPSLDEYLNLLLSCDLFLGNDSGGLYVAGASGIPAVGLFDHVEPWLRVPRVPNILALRLRQPECECGHHSACTRTTDPAAIPCKTGLDARLILKLLANAKRGPSRVWGMPHGAPDLYVWAGWPDIKGIDLRGQQVAMRRALAATSLHPVPHLTEGSIILAYPPKVVTRERLWALLTPRLDPQAKVTVEEIIAEVRGHSVVDPNRLRVLGECARAVRGLNGCIVELGVYQGGTARMMMRALPGRVTHLFDTFAGIPGDTLGALDEHEAGEFAADEAAVRTYLADQPFVFYHVGMFPETWVDTGPVAIAHCDCDTYAGTLAFLERVWPRLLPGGYLICDDYQWAPCAGVTVAMDEWFTGRPEQIEVAATQQCLVRKL